VTPRPRVFDRLESLVDRLSIVQALLEKRIESDERQLTERKRDARFLAELAAEARLALHEFVPEEISPPQPGRRGLEKSDPEKYERIVADLRRSGWTDNAIATRHGVDPKTVKRIRGEREVGKNVGKNPSESPIRWEKP
jgi:DNA-binding NarL/FixJ family response regulator